MNKETKWVGIINTGDYIYITGIFDKKSEAVGDAYLRIAEFSESFKGKNDYLQ